VLVLLAVLELVLIVFCESVHSESTNGMPASGDGGDGSGGGGALPLSAMIVSTSTSVSDSPSIITGTLDTTSNGGGALIRGMGVVVKGVVIFFLSFVPFTCQTIEI